MNRRRKRRVPFAAYAALIFNGALCATPFMGAYLISQAYGEKQTAFLDSPEALSATRAAMDDRFKHLAMDSSAQATPREVWSLMVRDAFDNKVEDNKPNLPLVRGLLLGAPAMIGGKDGEALRARVTVSDGDDDSAVLEAAVTYLPDDIQDEYQRVTQPIIGRFNNSAAPSPSTTPPAPDEPAEPRVAINRLGNLLGHTQIAVRWANDDKMDVTDFMLTGIGLILADPEAREGASVAMSVLRIRTQSPIPFKAYIARRIEEVAPLSEIKRLLGAELRSEVGSSLKAEAVVQRVFRTTIDPVKLEPLLAEFRILRDIARRTSVESAVAIVSRVNDAADLRAAGLVAAAGGDRAVALEHLDGDNLLDTARTVVPMTNALKLQIAGVAACILLLAFVAMTTFWKSFRRNKPIKKSAVYLMEEHPA